MNPDAPGGRYGASTWPVVRACIGRPACPRCRSFFVPFVPFVLFVGLPTDTFLTRFSSPPGRLRGHELRSETGRGPPLSRRHALDVLPGFGLRRASRAARQKPALTPRLRSRLATFLLV